MHRYNTSANALYDTDVVSIAVLCDSDPAWRPRSYSYGRWGGRTGTDFLPAKLLDHLADTPALQASTNPFAAVVLAHGQALATQSDPPTRRQLKLSLVKGLYERGWSEDDVRELFRIIDWIMTLPDELENAFREEVFHYEEEKTMRYLTGIERLAIKRGLEQGLEQGRAQGREQGRAEGLREALYEVIGDDLQDKFGQRGRRLLSKVRAIEDLAVLRDLRRKLRSATTLAEVREMLPKGPKANGERKS